MSRPRKVFFRRRKVCKFCADKIDYIDYKDVKLLQQFIPERSKILPRRISGTCADEINHASTFKYAQCVTSGTCRSQVIYSMRAADERSADYSDGWARRRAQDVARSQPPRRSVAAGRAISQES